MCRMAAINVRILLSPLWEASEEFLSEWATGKQSKRDSSNGNGKSTWRHNFRIRCVPLKSTPIWAFRGSHSAKDYRAAKGLPRTVEYTASKALRPWILAMQPASRTSSFKRRLFPRRLFPLFPPLLLMLLWLLALIRNYFSRGRRRRCAAR
jgi:hypothetical protein